MVYYSQNRTAEVGAARVRNPSLTGNAKVERHREKSRMVLCDQRLRGEAYAVPSFPAGRRCGRRQLSQFAHSAMLKALNS